MFHTEQEKTNFINHLEYLLSLGDVQRCRRTDWKALKRLLTAAGHWKRRYNASDKVKKLKQRWCIQQNNKRNIELYKLRELKEHYDNTQGHNY